MFMREDQNNFESYRESVREDLRACIDAKNCRPILFVGSGFAQRYFGLPDWHGLLKHLCDSCPIIEKEINFYLQRYDHDLLGIAEEFAQQYMDWGWSEEGRSHFPDDCRAQDANLQGFVKSFVAKYLLRLMDPFIRGDRLAMAYEELALLQAVRPFAIITTNYDTGAELVFPDYGVIVGEQILRADTNNLGDILKIHGCVSTPQSIVLTRSDYQDYTKKRKYLSAKLLTYFAEHPMIFIGYSVKDPNIQEILADIDEVLACNGEQVPNIYVISYKNPTTSSIADVPINTSDHHHVRVKEICSRDFGWIYEALGHQAALNLDIKTLRLLQSQLHRLIRADAPTGRIEVNYQTLKSVVGSEQGLSNVLGICAVGESAQINATHPFLLTEVGRELGYKYWHQAKRLLNNIKEYQGHDICASDNVYHVRISSGKGKVDKYSRELIDLLKAVRDGKEYEVKL